jgi:hypothetical protein
MVVSSLYPGEGVRELMATQAKRVLRTIKPYKD